LAPTAKWDLDAAISDSLHAFDQQILQAGDRPALHSFVRAHFGPLFAAMFFRGARRLEPAAISLLRAQLAALLVEEARDPQVTSALIPAVRAYLASDGLDTAGMSRDLMQEAMRAGVLEGGVSFEDALVTAFLKSGKEYVRQQVLIAAGATENPAYADRWLALAPRMRSGEVIALLRSDSNDWVMRGRIWAWLKTNYDALAGRLPPEAMGTISGAMARTCDEASRADLDSFFRPKLAALPGAARPLALAEEQIDRCIAFKAAKGAEIAAALRTAR
jgi:alanyl aminopeptidase